MSRSTLHRILRGRAGLSTSSVLWLLAALLLAGPVAARADEPLPILPKGLNEKVEMVTIGSGWSKLALETTFYVPSGPGPFPLVVINHGKDPGNPHFQGRARHTVAGREFVRRGYLVALPMRPGFSNSEGVYIDARCNIESNGYLQADTLIDFLREVTQRPDIDPNRILIVGQSHGGLSTMALGAKGFPGVRGLLNFAGGLRYTGESCNWEQALLGAFESFGKTTRVPSLWFYGDNDSYWGKDLPHEMFKVYQAAGGKARLVSYGVFPEGDAHGMFGSVSGLPIWWPETERFLIEIGLPTKPLFEVATTPRPPKTDFAALDNVDAAPLDERRKQVYRKFLTLPRPRAFAIAPTGNVGWAYQGDDPLTRALENCERIAKTACTLYAVDDDVVWQQPAGTAASTAK